MSLSEDIAAGFAAAAAIGGNFLRLGARARVPCLVPEGVEIEPTRRDGRVTNRVSASVTVLADDFGEPPLPTEKGALEVGGRSYQVAVSSGQTMTVTAGASLFSFVVDDE